MTLKQFLGLSTEAQFEEFWSHCIFLEHYVDIELKYHLYKLHNFYIELTSDDSGKLDPFLSAFIDGPRFDKYTLDGMKQVNDILDLE